jgi:type VI secretion system protein ImpK
MLEVYHLCLLLGFAGRYSLSGRGELRSIITTVGDKIRRIRQSSPDLSPGWALPNEKIQTGGYDPWIKRLMFSSIGCFAIALVLFIMYKIFLSSGVSSLERMASQGRS